MPTAVHSEEPSGSPPAVLTHRPKPAGRLRILHVVSHLGMGGTEHGVLKVVKGLGEEEFEHRICAVRGIDLNFANRMNVAPKAYTVGTGKPGFQFPLFRLARVMKEFAPHVVHSRNFGALEAIPAARLARVPVAIHSEHGYELETLTGLPLRRRLLCRALFAMADAVFTVTEDLRAFHAQQSWLPSRKFRLIYNGADTECFAPRPEAAVKVREELAIPKDRIVIGSVGRLVPIKDYGTLLQAAETLVRQGTDVHVLLAGTGPELESLRAYAEESPALAGRVTFPGASDRVSELLTAMDVFVLSSISEGMSNTILEAMASGLPVVATRAGGNTELVEEGRTGWLFSPRDVQSLSTHLLHLAGDAELRRAFGAAARRRAVEHFSLSGMLQRYRHLYVELAALRGVGREDQAN